MNLPNTEQLDTPNIDIELDKITQQMLVDYTAWVNGEPISWNVKKQEAKNSIKQLINSIVLEARIDELKSSLDKLIVQEGKLYKMFKSKSQEDKNICVGVKLMADRVSCLYDRIKELGDK